MTNPLVSVIMPVRNERQTIERALDSALGQCGPYRVEVVVADGGSHDGTREILERYAAQDARVRIVDNSETGTTPDGLNRALEAARGSLWVRLDGHSTIPSDYVLRLATHVCSGRSEAAGGVVRANGESRFGRAVAAATDSRFGVGNASHHYATEVGYVDHLTHALYRLDISRAIGGFDAGLVRNQDFDFDFRYCETGARILIDPSVVFLRGVREAPLPLASQYHQYGYWKYVVLRRHPSSLHLRWLVPPALVGTALCSLAFVGSGRGRRMFAATSAAYLSFLTLGAVSISKRVTGSRARDVAGALATMHFAWGSGFLRAAVTRR